jgi:hypothetical protein
MAAVAAAAALSVTAPVVVVGKVKMCHCHTHGLGKKAEHTSATCANPAGPQHKTEAIVSNMLGGNQQTHANDHPQRPCNNA